MGTAASSSRSRTWTSWTPARLGGRPSAAVGAVSASAASYPGCQRHSYVTFWSALHAAAAPQIGRATLGRSRRGKRFRRIVSGMPTRQFRDLLVGMTANVGLWVIVVDPGWTSKWAQRYTSARAQAE